MQYRQAVVIGVGANLGRPAEAVRDALQCFSCEENYLASSLYRTKPRDCAAGTPDFINAVLVFEGAAWLQRHGGQAPFRLLEQLLSLERLAGRRRLPGLRNAPRELDLDLLLFGTFACRDAGLQLPHPRATGRPFVLAPLAELLPGLVWPGDGRRVAELLALLPDDECARLPATRPAGDGY